MDKLLAELRAQQKNECEKKEQCNKDVDTTEDDIKAAELEKRDLAEAHKDLFPTIDKSTDEIATLKQEVAKFEASWYRQEGGE